MEEREISDADLLRRARRGEDAAFGHIVRRYVRPALAVAWEFSDSRDDAEDLVQEAFYRALRRLDRYDPGRPFGPWFFTIVRNLGRNQLARRDRWRTVPASDAVLTGRAETDPAEREQIRTRVESAVSTLAPRQRACFRLCEVEGFSRAEVAEMLDLSEATVRVHLHRAKQALRASLGSLDEAHTS